MMSVEVVGLMREAMLAVHNGKICFLNPKAEQLLQWNAAEAVGRSSREVVSLFRNVGGVMAPVPLASQPATGCGLIVNRHGAEIPVYFSLTGTDGEEFLLVALSPVEGAAAVSDEPASVLQRRMEGEDRIRHTVDSGEEAYAVLFQLERMALYAQRYGTEAARTIRLRYALHIHESLGLAPQGMAEGMYEWTGSSFIVLARSGGGGALREQLKQATARRVDVTLKGITAILSVTARYEIVPLAGDASADDILARLEYSAG
jgi:hypothetical protein